MLMTYRSRPSNPIVVGLLAILVVLYLLLVGLAAAMLPPAFALILGLLPFPLLLINRAFDFDPPLDLLRALFAFSIVLFLLWPRYMSFNFGGPDLVPARLSFGLLLVTWFMALASPSFRDATWKSFGRMRGWLILLAAYCLVRIASVIGSDAVGLSAYHTANEILTAVLIVPIIYSIYGTQAQFQKLLWYILIAAMAVSLLAVLERAMGKTLFAGLHLPGMNVDSEWLYAAVMEKSRGGVYRAQSTFSHPLLLAEFSAFALPIAIYFSAVAKGYKRAISVVAVLLIIGAGALTGSRAAFAAIPIALFLCLGLLMARQLIANRQLNVASVLMSIAFLTGVFCLGVLLVSGAIDTSLISGRNSAEASSTNTRMQMLLRGIPRILEHPFLGYGPGLSAYVAGVKNSISLTIDSHYLSIALDSGILGLGLYSLIFLGAVFVGLRFGFSNRNNPGLLCAMLAISLFGMLLVKAILSIPHNAPLIFLGFALITLSSRQPDDTKVRR